MARRTVTTEGARAGSLYPRLLGSAWAGLDGAVRAVHLEGEVRRLVGRFRVRRGAGRLARLLHAVLRLPSDAEVGALELVVTPCGDGECWSRRFGDGRRVVSRQAEGRGGVLVERVQGIELRFQLEEAGGALIYHQVGAALRWGPLCLPLASRLWPRVEAREEAHDSRQVRVTVEVRVPLAGRLIAYEGTLGGAEPLE